MNIDPIKARSLRDINFKIGKKIIEMAICTQYNLPSINVILIKCRKKELVIPRQIAHYFGMQCQGATLKSVGKYFGDKDHATVLHSQRTINDFVDRTEGGNIINPDIYNTVCLITSLIDEYSIQYKPAIIKKSPRLKRNDFHLKSWCRRYIHYKKIFYSMQEFNSIYHGQTP